MKSIVMAQSLTRGEKTVIFWRSLLVVPDTYHVVEFLKERLDLFMSSGAISHIDEHSQPSVLDLPECAGFDVAQMVGDLTTWINWVYASKQKI